MKHTNTWFNTAYELGKDAYYADVDDWDCPFSAQFDQEDYLAWTKGWTDAYREDIVGDEEDEDLAEDNE